MFHTLSVGQTAAADALVEHPTLVGHHIAASSTAPGVLAGSLAYAFSCPSQQSVQQWLQCAPVAGPEVAAAALDCPYNSLRHLCHSA